MPISWPAAEKNWGAQYIWGATASTSVFFVYFSSPMGAGSGADMPSHLKDVAGPGGAELPVVSFPNTSAASTPTPGNNRGCENGAFMDSFGIFLQGLLAVVAFSTLMCEYELRQSMRVWYLTLMETISQLIKSKWISVGCFQIQVYNRDSEKVTISAEMFSTETSLSYI